MKNIVFFLFTWMVKITGFLPYVFLFRTKISYEDKKVQSRRIKGPAIVVSNHRNLMDFAVAMYTFPGRTLRCVVAELMYRKNVFMTFLLRMLGTVEVDRTTNDFRFLAACSKILKQGGVVEIYPEARLPNPGDKVPLAFKPSAVYLALETGAPIIPICNNGRYFEKKCTRVHIGTPIDVRPMYREDLSKRENLANITEYIRERIIEYQDKLEQQEKEDEGRQ